MGNINFITRSLFRFSARNRWEAYKKKRKQKDIYGSSEILLDGIIKIEKFLKKEKHVDVIYDLSAQYEIVVPFDSLFDQLDSLTTSLTSFRDAVRLNDKYEISKELRKVTTAYSTMGSKTMKAVDYFSYQDRFALVQCASIFRKLLEHWVNLLFYIGNAKDPETLIAIVPSMSIIQRRITSIYIWFEILVGMSCDLNPVEIGAQYGDE